MTETLAGRVSVAGPPKSCSSCQVELPSGERYCGACGYDTHRDDHIATVLEPRLRQARGWILAVGIIYVVSAVLQVTLLERRLPGEAVTLMLTLNGALFLIHLGLWWWARTAPLAATVVALVLFVTLQLVEAAAQIVLDSLPLLEPVDQHREILDPPGERGTQVDLLFEPPALLQEALRFGLVLPEVGVTRARFDLGQLFRRTGGVKDSSAARRRASSGPRSGAAVLHDRMTARDLLQKKRT
jgi:hypothetical protein